jgi:hypothetical protein
VLITQDGGSAVIGDALAGYSYLTFPKNAIDADQHPDGVIIRFYWGSDGFLQADCYPEGLQFTVPVAMRLSYRNADIIGVNENNLAIYYFDPLKNRWESQGGIVNTSDKYVQSTITHFSRYAIGFE